MIDYLVKNQVAILTWNMPDRSVNVMNDESLELFGELIERAAADSEVKGLVITSGKRDFVAGADLASFFSDRTPQVIFDKTKLTHKLLRRLESCGKPVCAAINGTALGGGLEIALACHYRVVSDLPGIRLGLPEVKLGLLAGAGGTQRLPRLIGINAALPLLLEGKHLTVTDAKQMAIVDEVVPAEQLLDTAIAWVVAQTTPVQQPWDRKGFKLPGPVLTPLTAYDQFAIATARNTARTFNNFPAQRHILSAVYEGCQSDFDTGIKAEQRHFVGCACSSASRNMIRASFFGVADAAKLKSRPAGVPTLAIDCLGVIGAGMMGHGIALVAARAGLKVVLLDRTLADAEQGRQRAVDILVKSAAREGLTEARVQEIAGRIEAAQDYEKLKPCQLVVEAVFEDRVLKAEITAKAEAQMPATAILGSNTSMLPISGLAEASSRPGNFIGIHFFSPVNRMRLVEIIRGRETSDACLAQTMDFVKRLGKVPIVVNDSHGFYTSRVFQKFLDEGQSMVAEGIAPALVENAARHAGMPVGPLALTDEVSFDLQHHLIAEAKIAQGSAYQSKAADEVVALFYHRLQRRGRKAGAGFYDYSAEGKRLWPGLAEHYPLLKEQPSVEVVKKRLLYVQGLEAARCLQDGVVTHPMDADVGALLGWSFPEYLGGPFGMIDTIGVVAFVDACRALADQYGPRFEPPPLLLDKAERSELFYAA